MKAGQAAPVAVERSTRRKTLLGSRGVKLILLIEDDTKLARQLGETLTAEGLATHGVTNSAALDSALADQALQPDLVVMDRLLGPEDTKERMGSIRRRWPAAPLLVISAINTPTERAALINEGADDYLGKPFLTEELLARARSLLRRRPEAKPESRRIGRATLDLTSRRLSVGPEFADLSQKEFLILNALSEGRRVISRPELLELGWGNVNHSERNLVEATITNLRRRLLGLECGFEIKNQRNTGYWIED